ncbi:MULTISPECIES: NAD-dependent epimerase/dehydratase family protein [Solibacillus]|uniref:NAD-dependent epimerase/dehydratase family protein n=1 Tax=Solibacillus merdavium TaxID=2762218 RepID=A0ABR8XP87_9BACL|nr:NAD-dependent epimerase/dehydratase family protein [Solibacillus merdavium]MBD8033731.1 NAD-dependent epimerase/dehydratase family protein [Solibacillus merdavium]
MKKILVLGGTRFFGRKLVDLLLEQKHEVTIVTRGVSENPFGEAVEHIKVDRKEKAAFEKALENRTFDIVYDNICYSPNEAKQLCDMFKGKIGKLVFTSTLATYEADGMPHAEGDFDPTSYEIVMGDTHEFTYGEGKRLAEAVFYRFADFPVVAVRFPIVMGEDDYTRRLHFHIERIVNNEPIGFSNMDAEMSFIQATEAARFLMWAGMGNVEGPINATANGVIALKDLISLIEEKTGERAKIALLGTEEIRSPYAIPASWYMKNDKSQQLGFKFSHIDDWLPQLVEEIAKSTPKQ